MDKEIEFIKQDGNLVTLRATRKFLEDLIVFLKDTPAIGEEFWGFRSQYSDCLDLAVDLEDMLAHEQGDILEFQRDKEYFFYQMHDAMRISFSGIRRHVFPTISTLPKKRLEKINDQIVNIYYGQCTA